MTISKHLEMGSSKLARVFSAILGRSSDIARKRLKSEIHVQSIRIDRIGPKRAALLSNHQCSLAAIMLCQQRCSTMPVFMTDAVAIVAVIANALARQSLRTQVNAQEMESSSTGENLIFAQCNAVIVR